MTEEAFPDALPVGYRLHWYVLEHVLGQGGFGITHLAHDTNLDRRVAIKEYLPTDFARRRSDATVHPRTQSSEERYAWGLERFIAEARTLARFDHPNIVRVLSVFEANNTAYMVMRFEQGENLATLLDRSGTLPERQLLDLMLPILEGLELVHDAGFIHRDVKPENIYVRKDGSPVLLDFGSARQSLGRSKTMTILVAPGYAPLEQYYGDAETQGPWTDIYGLGATCYRAISGRAPLDAIARAKGVLGSAREPMQLARDLGRGRYSERLLAAVDHALQLGERDRPQSVDEWRRELVGTAAPATHGAPPTLGSDMSPLPQVRSSAIAPAQPAPERPRSPMPTEAPTAPTRSRAPLYWGVTASAVAVAAGVVMIWPAQRPSAPPAPALSAAPTASSDATASTTQTVEPPRIPEPKPELVAPSVEAPVVRPALAPPPTAPSPTLESGSNPRETRTARRSVPAVPAPIAPDPASQRLMALAPLPAPAATPVPAPAPASAPATAPAAAFASSAVGRDAPSDRVALPSARDAQLDAAAAALQRGDATGAARLLAPLAAAGVTKAQVMLGRATEAGRGQQESSLQAYIWYSIAARLGEPAAAELRDRMASRLQPAEVRQAERVVEAWKPHAEPPAVAAVR